MNDKSNIINILLLLLTIGLAISLGIFAFNSFEAGNYFNFIWLTAYAIPWVIPSFRDRLEQAINFIKRKFRK